MNTYEIQINESIDTVNTQVIPLLKDRSVVIVSVTGDTIYTTLVVELGGQGTAFEIIEDELGFETDES